MTLIVVERRDARGPTFPEDLLNYAPIVSPENNQVCGVIFVVKGRVSRDQPVPKLGSAAPQRPPNFWDLKFVCTHTA